MNLKVTICFLLAITSFVFAQSKSDIIITNDLDIIEVKVLKVTDQEIIFSYPNEKLENSMSVNKIAKIKFANGRIQEFDNSPAVNVSNDSNSGYDEGPLEPQHNLAEAPAMMANTISVLPAFFVIRDEYNKSQSSRVQSYAEDFIKKKGGKLRVQYLESHKVNSRLRNAGVERTEINEYDPAELSQICGTEYVLMVEVNKQLKDEVTTYSRGGTERSGNWTFTSDDETVKKVEYETHTQVWIYKNDGTLVYERKIKPFDFGGGIHFEAEDWMGQINFLLKRSPFFSR